MPVFRKIDEAYWRGKSQPWGVRVLITWPWLQRLQWWHVLVPLLLAGAAGATWLAIRPTPDSDTRTVAIVDGVAIGEADLIAETGGPVGPDQRGRVLQAVIDRRLLAAAASREAGASTPEAMAVARRAQEGVLAAAIARRIVGDVRADDAAALRYMAAHPAMFARRQLLLVDAGPIDPAIANGPALAKAETLAQAETALRPTGTKLVHERRVIDSGSLPEELAAKLATVAPGRLFLVPMGGTAMLGEVVERSAMVMPEAIQLEQARAGASAEIREARLKTALKAIRAKAVIRIPG